MKKLSVITINFNDVDGIRKTHSELVSQKNNDWEWICIDGASTDGSVEFINENHSSFDVVVSEQDSGIYDAMNKGFRISSGEYVMFVNSGDWLVDGGIEEALGVLKGTNSSIVLFDGVVIYYDMISRVRKARDLSFAPYGIPALHQSTVYKRSDMPVDGYDLKFKICGDHWLAAYFWKANSSSLIVNKLMGVHPIHGGAASKSYFSTYSESIEIERDFCGQSFLACLLSVMKRLRSRVGVAVVTSSLVRRSPRLCEFVFGASVIKSDGV